MEIKKLPNGVFAVYDGNRVIASGTDAATTRSDAIKRMLMTADQIKSVFPETTTGKGKNKVTVIGFGLPIVTVESPTVKLESVGPKKPDTPPAKPDTTAKPADKKRVSNKEKTVTVEITAKAKPGSAPDAVTVDFTVPPLLPPKKDGEESNKRELPTEFRARMGNTVLNNQALILTEESFEGSYCSDQEDCSSCSLAQLKLCRGTQAEIKHLQAAGKLELPISLETEQGISNILVKVASEATKARKAIGV